MVGRKKSFISGCGQMILKFQSANMLNALHLGIFKNVGALVSLQPGPAKYFYRTRMSADVLSLSPKMPLLEVDDMLMQDHKTVFVQKSTSQVYWIYLEFVEMANLAALTKRWGKIACSCAMNYFPSLLKHVISSQARQNKYKHRMMWLSAEMYCVWGGCNTRDAKNIWSNSICCIPQWPYLLDSFEWAVYGGLAQHFTPQSTVPMQWTALLIWCCVGRRKWHHQMPKYHLQIMTMREHNDCRDPTIIPWSFCIDFREALCRLVFPKLKQKVRWLGTSIWFCWDSRHI